MPPDGVVFDFDGFAESLRYYCHCIPSFDEWWKIQSCVGNLQDCRDPFKCFSDIESQGSWKTR